LLPCFRNLQRWLMSQRYSRKCAEPASQRTQHTCARVGEVRVRVHTCCSHPADSLGSVLCCCSRCRGALLSCPRLHGPPGCMRPRLRGVQASSLLPPTQLTNVIV
jgi:hypothetical protein